MRTKSLCWRNDHESDQIVVAPAADATTLLLGALAAELGSRGVSVWISLREPACVNRDVQPCISHRQRLAVVKREGSRKRRYQASGARRIGDFGSRLLQ